MRPIVSFCGYPTYRLAKYPTTLLQPTATFFDIMKTTCIPDNYKLVSFYMKSLFTRVHWNHHQTIHWQTSFTNRRHETTDTVSHPCTFGTTANITNSYTGLLWAHQFQTCQVSRIFFHNMLSCTQNRYSRILLKLDLISMQLLVFLCQLWYPINSQIKVILTRPVLWARCVWTLSKFFTWHFSK